MDRFGEGRDRLQLDPFEIVGRRLAQRQLFHQQRCAVRPLDRTPLIF